MKLPIISRSRHERQIEAAREATRRAEKELVAEKLRHALELAGSEAANTRLAGRNRELARRLDAAHDSQLTDFADATRLTEELRAAERRAELLQARLDDAVGMPQGGRIQSSGPWQPGYEKPKPKADA